MSCEVELDLLLTNTYVFNERFQINSTKLYALVVTLSINDNIKFLENVNQGFRRKN